MLVIDQTQNNATAEVHVGDSFRVQLSENPTTGYRWHLQSGATPALRLLEDSFAASQGGPGGGGLRYWTFAADKSGPVGLRIDLKPSWQPQSVETFTATINVKAR
jgi:inhibitor of cysteine peptidase